MDLRIKRAVLELTSTGNGSAPVAPSVDDERGWGAIAYFARAVGGGARIDELLSEGTRVTVLVPVAKLAAGAAVPLAEAAASR